jgi:hypothetical protein
MKDLRAVLEAADPLRDAPSISSADARDIRRRVLGAAETPVLMIFPRALPVAALVVVMIVAGLAAGRRFATAAPPRAAEDATMRRPVDGDRRQVQFATPGGTRIIWTIDPNFHMRGTLP